MSNQYAHPYYGGENVQPQMKDLCRRYTDHFVQIQTRDGHTFQAIIINVDIDRIMILVPEEFDGDTMDSNGQFERQFGYYRPRFFRFRRFALPIAALAGLSLLPFAFPFYPYYSPYPYFY